SDAELAAERDLAEFARALERRGRRADADTAAAAAAGSGARTTRSRAWSWTCTWARPARWPPTAAPATRPHAWPDWTGIGSGPPARSAR
ncbi:hypothetical protein ACTD5D_00095, partial [Nocardia takedensis]|uniref:hypothetical protein n=1 Tax=Nocardia takedensis TaxID=259390 RepID=UPI003F767D9E